MPLVLDTERTIYVAHNVTTGKIGVLLPKALVTQGFELQELRLDDPDPASTDSAEYKLLAGQMDETEIQLP